MMQSLPGFVAFHFPWPWRDAKAEVAHRAYGHGDSNQHPLEAKSPGKSQQSESEALGSKLGTPFSKVLYGEHHARRRQGVMAEL